LEAAFKRELVIIVEKLGHLKKNCPIMRESQGLSRGNGRSGMKINPSGGPASNFR